MAADKEFAMTQLERFAGFPGVPQTALDLEDRARYLANISADNDECFRIAERMFRTLRFFPLPVDIEIAAENHSLKDWEPRDASTCDCGGTGWISFDKNGYSFAKRCHCIPTDGSQ